VIDQGEIVTFSNTDPYLPHGVASDYGFGGRSAFDTPVIGRGQTRLVRGAPFLSSGGSPYTFRDPAHPGMTAQLFVTAAGAPLPLDSAPPTAQVKIRSGRVGGIARSRKLRLAVRVSEAVDLVAKAKLGRVRLGRVERTYVSPVRRVIGLPLDTTRPLRARGPVRIRVTVKLRDVAGILGTVTASRLLGGATPPGKR
jgi:hypothetical protein